MCKVICHLNAIVSCFGCNTEGIPDLGQMMGANVAVAFVVPLRCLAPDLSFKFWYTFLAICFNETYFMSTRAKCMIFDFPGELGSIRYREAKTTPRTPPNSSEASMCSTDVSTITQASWVRDRFVVYDL